MNFDETMKTLKKLGTPQNVKTYRRFGAGDNVFGVSFGELNKLKKKIKIDHELAVKLWRTENADARTLALLVADPEQFTSTQADTWLKEISYPVHVGYVARLVALTPFAAKKLGKWTKQKKEMVRECGYALLCELLRIDDEAISEEDCLAFLERIEAEIHSSANQARHMMNMAACSIGISRPQLRDDVLKASDRIGKVEVDHGETSCTTPNIAAYVLKASKRKSPRRRRH